LQTNYVLASRISVWLMDAAAVVEDEDALMMLSKPERLSCKLVGINVWRKLWFPAPDRPMIEGQLPVVFFPTFRIYSFTYSDGWAFWLWRLSPAGGYI